MELYVPAMTKFCIFFFYYFSLPVTNSMQVSTIEYIRSSSVMQYGRVTGQVCWELEIPKCYKELL